MADDVHVGAEQLGYAVLDAAGGQLGPLTALYADSDTGEIVFGGITMIRRGRRRAVFVPLASATVEGRTVTVTSGKLLVRRAPAAIAGRSPSVEDEPDLYAHYDLRYVAPDGATNRLVPVPS